MTKEELEKKIVDSTAEQLESLHGMIERGKVCLTGYQMKLDNVRPHRQGGLPPNLPRFLPNSWGSEEEADCTLTLTFHFRAPTKEK